MNTHKTTAPRPVAPRSVAARLPATALIALFAGSTMSHNASAQSTEPFPAEFQLSRLLPANGGNGADGVVLTSNQIGRSVSSAGDLNGDGIDDLIIGAYLAAPNGNTNAGESYVVFGAPGIATGGVFELSSLNGSNGFVLNGIDASDFSGFSVSSAGDVNGDGFGDLIIGAHYADPNGISSGESYVVFGAADLGTGGVLELSALIGPNGFVLNGIHLYDHSGFSVSSAGDVNGDDLDDLIIGAERADPNGNTNAGESYLVFGALDLGNGGVGTGGEFNLSALNGPNGFVLNGIDADDRSGNSVSSAGDVNGDGFDDLIIGAHYADLKTGESYLVFGAPDLGTGGVGTGGSFGLSSLNGPNGFVLNGRNWYDHSGVSVSSAGDVNGDGFDDLIIGAIFACGFDDRAKAGQSYVVFGATDLGTGDVGTGGSYNLSSLSAGPDAGANGFVLFGFGIQDYSGRSVSSAGDVNGDGIDDLIIGADWANPNQNIDAGESYVVFGAINLGSGGVGTNGRFQLLGSLFPAGGGDGTNGLVLNGVDRDTYSGRSVSSAGDVNGDGIDDLVIGAAFGGESYVVFGHDLGDADRDSLSYLDEIALGTDPLAPDTDGDGLTDGFEVNGFGTNPLLADSDGDGILDPFDTAPACPADVNGDGILDNGDIIMFIALFIAGCP